MPKKKCAYARCRLYIDYRQTYCDEHKKQKNNEYNKQVRNATEFDREVSKFYASASWRKMRNKKITEQPLCEICLMNEHIKVANIVHHIIEVRDDFDKRLDYNNLQSVCRSCHNAEHGGTKKYY